MHRIEDPLSDQARKVYDNEIKIVDTPEFQRLRRIRQLGHSSTTYPNAVHNRFLHSLGVMETAGKMAESINLSEEEIRNYRLGGLLHDIGHGPYSHATEPFFEDVLDKEHEYFSCQIIDDLAERGLIDNPEHIKDIILGKDKYNIVNGIIDADRLDYLQRDVHATGVEHGHVEEDTIISAMEYDEEYGIVYKRYAIEALEGLLMSRSQMTTSVYQQSTTQIAESMLLKSIQEYYKEHDVSAETLHEYDDYELRYILGHADGAGSKLFNRLINRELYTDAINIQATDVNITRDDIHEIEQFCSDNIHGLEEQIAELSNTDVNKIIINAPSAPDAPEDFELYIKEDDTIRPLSDFSVLNYSLVESEWRRTSLGVYCPEEHEEAVRTASKNIFPI